MTDLEEDNEDICHQGDSLPNDVAETLEVHKRDDGANNEKTVFESESHPHLLFQEPVELFCLFVNNEICKMICCETE